MNAGTTRQIPSIARRGVEKPKPLRGVSGPQFKTVSVEELCDLFQHVITSCRTGNYGSGVFEDIVTLNISLKRLGKQIEASEDKNKIHEHLNELKKICGDDCLGMVARLHILEILELRAMNWTLDEKVEAYYKQQLAEHGFFLPSTTPLNVSAADFAPASQKTSVAVTDSTTPKKILRPVFPSPLSRPQFEKDSLVDFRVPQELLKIENEGGAHEQMRKTFIVGQDRIVVSASNQSLLQAMERVVFEYLRLHSDFSPRAPFTISGQGSQNGRLLSKAEESFTKPDNSDSNNNISPDCFARKQDGMLKYDRQFLYECSLCEQAMKPPRYLEDILEKFPDLRKSSPENRDCSMMNRNREVRACLAPHRFVSTSGKPLSSRDWNPPRISMTNNPQLEFIKKHLSQRGQMDFENAPPPSRA